MPVRFDCDRIDAVERLSSGAARVPAVVSRAGVFSYPRADGTIVREWRPEEEVFRADSIASIEDVPVTIGHPPRGMRLDNWQADTIGHVRAGAKRDDSVAGIRTSVIVSRPDAVPRVLDQSRADALRDLSPGYDVRIDETSGIVPAGHADAGKPYDRIQRDIRYNHLAALPRGAGRQGAAVSLRLDSADDLVIDEPRADEFPPAKEGEFPPAAKKKTGKSKDGEPMTDDEKTAYEAEKKKAETEKARADKAEAELARYRADEATRARTELETRAREVMGKDHKFDSAETPRQIQEAVCKRADASFDAAGKSDAYVEACFDLALKNASKRADGESHAQRVLGGFIPRVDAAAPGGAIGHVLKIVNPTTQK
jgi:hypothetical protein